MIFKDTLLQAFDEFTGDRKTRFTDLPSTVNPIPTNSIVYKTVTGIGATYSELEAKRNSIIMLPHISIIKSKQQFHKDLHNSFAVYKDFNHEEIITYLKANKGYAKFLTTPKGLDKIQLAVEALGQSLYEDYFLLIDECHKIIRDAKYREDMVPPMDDFFEFKNKAMISATPIPPTDPRFEEHNFKKIELVPNFNHKKALKLIHSNGLLNAFRDVTEEYVDDQFYVFFNSIEGIKSIINQLNIASDSALFCSLENERLLKDQVNFPINSQFDVASAKKYNFFTSSFYNGLDIILNEKPILVMLSDVGFADFSMVDPSTDVLQIIGRLRNGYKQAIHINNAAKWTNPIDEETARNRVALSKAAYNAIDALSKAYTGDAEINFMGQLLERMRPYYNLINEDMQFSYFKMDNYLLEERIKCYYQNSRSLSNAYTQCGLYKIEDVRKDFEKIEVENLSRGLKKYSRSNVEKVICQLQALEGLYGTELYDQYIKQLQSTFPLLTEAYFELGPDIMDQLKYNITAITRALVKNDIKKKKNSTALIEFLYQQFKLGIPYLCRDVKISLQKIYDELEIKSTAVATDLNYYFYIKEYNKSINGSSNRGYVLTDYKFNILQKYKRA